MRRLILVLCLLAASIFMTYVPTHAQAAWAPNTAYSVGTLVTYGGSVYKCIQAHTSLVGWEPPNTPSLWQLQSGTVPTNTNTPVATTGSTNTPTKTNTPVIITATPMPNTDGTPYNGNTPSLPGTVQVENFNSGGQNIAYNDAEATNQGGQYRTTEGVDIEATTDTGAGYNVGWTAAGEWLKYTVSVQTAGTYNLDFRVASAQAGGSFHLEVDNINVTGALTVPNTGGWQTWTTVSKTGVNLVAGIHIMKLVMDAAGGNFNSFTANAVTTGQPDLVISSISYIGSNPACLNQPKDQITVANNGTASAGSFVLRINGMDQTISGLAAGASTSVTIGATTSVTATADATNLVVESNETNNSSTTNLPIPTQAPTCTPSVATNTPTRTSTNTPTKTNTPTATQPTSNDGTPYGGTARTVPGTIQAEDFNVGGQGVAYNDAETTNQGGQYRTTEGVDIEASTDTGAGYNVGWTANGEWMKYTVNVTTGGAYTIDFRLASAQAGGSIHLEVDGVNVTGALTVPNTGGWQTWTTVTKTGVNLTTGSHVLRLVTDATGGNYNWIKFSSGTATATPVPTNTNTPVPSNGKALMAYWTYWGPLGVSSIPANKLTHILYAFSDMNINGQCASLEGAAAATHMNELKNLKAQYPHLKVLVSVGGWGASQYFSRNVTTATQRTNMVKSCIDLWIKGINMAGPGIVDGIDIDWEYPGSPGNTNDYSAADKANYTALMQEFRNQLNAQGTADGKYYTISAALGITSGVITNGYDLPALNNSLDYFNLMTYDMHGSWDTTTNFHSSLYPITGDPSAGNGLSVDEAVNRYVSAGVSKSKIVVGVPFYGHGWSNVGSTNNGLFQPGSSPYYETVYRDIKANYETNAAYTKFRHSQGRSVWVYSSSARVFIGYEDPTSAGEKGAYVVNNGLKGAMFWEQSQDDSTFSLTQALCTNLGLAASGRC